jgi:predicted deacetylase
MDRYVLISLHDVTPFHLERLQHAENLLKELGIEKVTYLFIPDYHSRTPTLRPAESKAYRIWINQKRPFQIQWVLHGYTHKGPGAMTTSRLSAIARLKNRFLTANEAEFLHLDRLGTLERIQQGRRSFVRHLEVTPEGFIAPAWLYNEHLFACLKELGFLFTENHRRIQLLSRSRYLYAPVITWATRTLWRKYSSQLICPVLSRIWSGQKVIRIAMHPFDFDHPSTVASIRKVISGAIKYRKQAIYSQLVSN